MDTEIKVGSIIEFWHGYNSDIRGQFKVTKIEGEDIYLDWVCHWFPIRNEKRREIKVIN